MASLANLRNALASLVPAWLYEADGGKVLHALATLIDASVQLDRDRTEVRFPRRASPSANTLTGQDRGIQQGRTESPAHYAERLIAWRYPRGHRVRGSAWALLEQISEYFGGLQVGSLDVSGNQYLRLVDGTEQQTPGMAWVWGVPNPTAWARFWVTLYSSAAVGPITPALDLGDPMLWTDGTMGLRGITNGDAKAIRALFARTTFAVPWHPCGSTPEWAVVAFHGSNVTPGTDYDRWSKVVANLQVATRDPGFRYFALSPTANVYVEAATIFVPHVTLPDGTTYDGAATYANPITYPDGTSHLDKVSPSFVTGVLLPDDASAVIGT